MKINYENYLHRIDLSLKDKTQQEIYMTYIMIAAAIFAFSYILFWDSSFKNFKKTQTNITQLENKINMDKRFLQQNPAYKITKLKREIDNINKKITLTKDANAYIKNKIETISSLIYDERSWGEYLDSITTNAEKYHIKLLSLTNKYAKANSAFGHILDISIDAEGDFQNTLEFINSLEQSDLVVDIHDFKMDAKASLESNLNISVWGIIY